MNGESDIIKSCMEFYKNQMLINVNTIKAHRFSWAGHVMQIIENGHTKTGQGEKCLADQDWDGLRCVRVLKGIGL